MPTTFETAVKACSPLAEHYRQGLRALSLSYRRKIRVKQGTDITGSIAIDDVLATINPNDPRWDYGIGFRYKTQPPQSNDSVCWVEIHPASSPHDAKEVIAKLAFHRSWLNGNAPELAALRGEFVWIATGKVAIPGHHRRQVAAKGIKLQGQVHQL